MHNNNIVYRQVIVGSKRYTREDIMWIVCSPKGIQMTEDYFIQS